MSAIRIFAKKGLFQFLIRSPPKATVDGQEHELAWGREVSIPATAGTHTVEIGFRYLGKVRGRASVQTTAGDPGPLLRYKTPVLMTSAGKLQAS